MCVFIYKGTMYLIMLFLLVLKVKKYNVKHLLICAMKNSRNDLKENKKLVFLKNIDNF